MELSRVQKPEDLQIIYSKMKLNDTAQKISYLKNAMKIRATRCDIPDTPEEELISLEELALSHVWEGLQA